MEGPSIHDRREDHAPDVHQYHPAPFAWVGEIASLGDWDALALIPAGIVCITTLKEGHHVAVSSVACPTVQYLVCFRGDAMLPTSLKEMGEASSGSIRRGQSCQGWRVNGTVVVEHLLKVVSKDRHVFFPIGGNVAVRYFHGNCD